MAVESVISGVGQLGTVADNLINSGDKVKIAEYQAKGEVAKAEAIIAAAQAKAQAEVDAKKSKQTMTFIIIGVVAFLVIVLVVLLTRKKPVPVQYVQQRPIQYALPSPVMPIAQQKPVMQAA